MTNAYSPLKVFHHQEKLQQIREGQHVAPIRVQLIPTNRCNQSCIGCAYRMEGYSSNAQFNAGDQIPWAKLKEIISDCVLLGVQAIEITGGGEPSIHPNFLDLCDLILSSGIKLGVVTNGASLSHKCIEVLADASWVRFSIDAGNKQTYASYRRVSPEIYHVALENVRLLSEARTNEDLLVGVGFVVNKYNCSEVYNAAMNALKDGADNFRISALFQNEGADYFKSFYDEAVNNCRLAEQLTSKHFKVFNLFGDRIDDLCDMSPDYEKCGYSKLTTYIGADQNVYTCCINAYNSTGLLGSFKDQSFLELWNNQETIDTLQKLNATNCHHCMYNGKNKVIQYALEENPTHAEFI